MCIPRRDLSIPMICHYVHVHTLTRLSNRHYGARYSITFETMAAPSAYDPVEEGPSDEGQSVEERITLFAAKNGTYPGAILISRQGLSIPSLPILRALTYPMTFSMATVKDVINKLLHSGASEDPAALYKIVKERYYVLDIDTRFAATFFDYYVTRETGSPFKHRYSARNVDDMAKFYADVHIPQPSVNVGDAVRIADNASYVEESKLLSKIVTPTTKRMLDLYDKFHEEHPDLYVNSDRLTLERSISNRGRSLTEVDIHVIFSAIYVSDIIPFVGYNDEQMKFKLHRDVRDVSLGRKYQEKGVLFIGPNISITLDSSVVQYSDDLGSVEAELTRLGYTLGEPKPSSFKTTIEFYDDIIDYHLLHDMILLRPDMRDYFVISDANYRDGDSSKIKMFYRNPRHDVPGLDEPRQRNLQFTITNYVDIKNMIDVNMVSIELMEIREPGLDDQFLYNILALMQYYYENAVALQEEYYVFFGDEALPKDIEIDNLKRLQNAKPRYFTGRFTSACVGATLQPRFISEDEYNSLPESVRSQSAMKFEDLEYIEKGEPDPSPIWITCHKNGETKYIYMKSDHHPCCKRSQNAAGTHEKATKKMVLNQHNELNPGTRGHLAGFSDLFSRYPVEEKATTNAHAERLGISQDGNALLTAIGYLMDIDADELKQEILDVGIFGPFRQCMYDQKWYDIKRYLETQTQWDSDLVIDGISACLSVNIVVLEIVDKRSFVRLPRYKFMYYRTFFENRPTIFIYRNDKRRKTTYEPVIIYGGKVGKDEYKRLDAEILPKLMTKLNFDYRYSCIDTRTDIAESLTIFSLREDDNYWENREQIIDGYGKLAGEIINGVPVLYDRRFDPAYAKHVETSDLVLKPSYPNLNFVHDLREKQADCMSRDESGKLIWKGAIREYTGLIDSDMGEDGRMVVTIPVSTPPTINPDDLKEALHIRNIMLQYISWLYVLSKLTPDGFMNKHVIISKQKLPAYKFPTGVVVLPLHTFPDAMKFVASTTNLVVNSKIVLPSEKVADGVEHMLRLIPKSSRVPITEIYDDNRGSTSERANEVILYGENNIRAYISNLSAVTYAPIRRITTRSDENVHPYAIYTSDGKMYLVQKVQENDGKFRAMNCVAQWYYKRINTGYGTDVLGAADATTLSKYIAEYTLDDNMRLTPVKGEGLLKILFHNRHYAALLEVYDEEGHPAAE